ncbi:hypothetical protein OG568_48280 (plasmid) [Streptomyces sp. NBC_01450]|uniref:hypothetical protein n=1 Tax=Streptomyces sp. NBC_01450 TaxID=2903871 RepID=UPI002E3553F8|nr:hypothetical protein [Streptomyces sp. NBC_01450]
MDAKQLKLSSQKWMTAALTAFSQGTESFDFAVHHAGIAAEHLLKAYLATLHPALIVEARDFDSLLHATGHGTHASAPASQAKTIGLVEAHSRVHKILRKQIPIDRKALEPVANARNGVAHSGVHDVSEVQTVFTTCLRLIDPLLTELQIAPESYWGSYTSLHDRLIEERVKAARIQLERKLAKARAVFEQRYGHLAPKERQVVLATITQQPPGYMEYDEERPCPACGSRGWLVGDTHLDETNEPVVVFTPYIFACSACGIDVENEEFWELGDLGDEVILDVPPEDFYVNWEPDPKFLPDDDPDDPTIDANWDPDRYDAGGR